MPFTAADLQGYDTGILWEVPLSQGMVFEGGETRLGRFTGPIARLSSIEGFTRDSKTDLANQCVYLYSYTD